MSKQQRLSLADAYQLAARHYAAGDLREAETVGRQILQHVPDQPQTLHLLSVIAFQRDRVEEAARLAQAAVDAHDGDANFHIALAMAHKACGRIDAAVSSYGRALELDANHAGALNNLSNLLRETGAHDQAIAMARRAVAAQGDLPQAHNNLAAALRAAGRTDEAIEHYQRALRLSPGDAQVLNNLGNAMQDRGDLAEAERLHRQAIDADAAFAGAWFSLAGALAKQHHVDEAIDAYERAAELDGDDLDARHNMANLLRDVGEIEQALDLLRAVLEADASRIDAQRDLAVALNYQPGIAPDAVCAAHQAWAAAFECSIATLPPRTHRTDSDSDRAPLRIGYLSPDFRAHPVARFMLPLLRAHDRARVTAYAYADVATPDAMTDQLESAAHVWCDVAGMTDDQLAARIVADDIDVLVDLAGHTDGHRLGVLARRPAPLVATYLGYPNTTGLSRVDWRITDAVADPPDAPTPGSERLVRIAGGMSCDAPPADAPPVNALPAQRVGHITFGSLAKAAKPNDQLLALWARVLHAVPRARLLIVRTDLSPRTRSRITATLARHGIDEARLTLDASPPDGSPLGSYHRMDISLDTWPYAGHTSVCDALWMGVPVVTLRGDAAVSRMGAGVLTEADCPGWIADDADAYVALAAALAGDLPALADQRAKLRERVRASRLTDGRAFAAAFEDALLAARRQGRAGS